MSGRVSFVGVRTALPAALAAVALVTSLLQSASASGANERVSIATNGTQGNNISARFAGPAISADGRVVAFDSIATTLVSQDSNNVADVFVRDRNTSITERVSVTSNGAQANGTSTRPVLGAAGNLVAFDSVATNLVGADTNQAHDVFVHNRATNVTQRVSVSSSEAQGGGASHSPSISGNGQFVSFVSTADNLVPNDTNGVEDIFVRDLVAGTTELVSLTSTGGLANSSTTSASISDDGRWVAFSSFATNIVPGDDNGHFDVFIRDRLMGTTQIVSVDSAENPGDAPSSGPRVSGNGQFVVYSSDATNLVPGDTNERTDVFLRDIAAGTTERVSVSDDEQQSNGSSPEPGVRGLTVSTPDITPDGRFVAFFSSATNLVPNDTNTCPPVFDAEPGRCPDVFIRDRVEGTTVRINHAFDGSETNERSSDPAMSDNGLVVAFFSIASNVVPNDTNVCPPVFPDNCPDVFVHDQGGAPGASADLSITKADSPDPVGAGEQLTYTLTVGNAGPDPATGVTVTDSLPAGVTFVSAVTSQGSCAGTSTVTCDLGDVAVGASPTVTITVTPTSDGTLTNTASVASSLADPNGANNLATATTTVGGGAGDCTITGTGGRDSLRGTPQADVICGLGGNDSIRGLGGDDTLLGGLGNDSLRGEAGSDSLFGDQGDDRLSGGDGDDSLDGGPGSDELDGNRGVDACTNGEVVANCEP